MKRPSRPASDPGRGAWLVPRRRSRDAPEPAGARRTTARNSKSIDVQPLPGQQVQLTLRLSGPAPQPLSLHHRQSGAHLA